MTWDRDAPTGGNTYNEGLLAAWRERGVEVVVHRLPGPWPAGDAESHAALAAVLAAEPVALVDGIVASGAPAVLARTRGRISVLVHMPLPADPALDDATRQAYADREKAALRMAAAVISPSASAATDVHDRYGVRAVVAPPGNPPGPVASGSRPPRLLVLGALTALKRPLTAVDAVAALPRADVRLDVVGSEQAEPAYAARVRAVARLDPRVVVHGVVRGSALEAMWSRTDLLVHPSSFETFGLAVSEALAHGVPAVVAAGTAAADTVATSGAGTTYEPAELSAVLDRWLTDGVLRQAWRDAALGARARLPGWSDTADLILAAVTGAPAPWQP